MFDINQLIRKNIRSLKPYSSARDEFSGEGSVFLDANENSFGSPIERNYHRYPDPFQKKVKEKIAEIKGGIPPAHIFLGNGSDECIDLLFRAFCEPRIDNVIICPPTYGMYKVSAGINDIEVREAPLDKEFQLQIEEVKKQIDENTKMIFLCSPNNPTGNTLYREDIEDLLKHFDGLVVIDEAYINFSHYLSYLQDLKDYPNLVILQTFSKAWGMAGLRLGILFGILPVINILNRIKPPYNVNQATQEMALEAMDKLDVVNERIKDIVDEREKLMIEFGDFSFVQNVYQSDANFILVKMRKAAEKYHALVKEGIIVRDRSKVMLCDDCLRITVGTPEENRQLMAALKKL